MKTMMRQTTLASYPWVSELEKTVVNSLATSFGLDFLFFQDKLGGNVDTVHNVRQGIWATETEKQQYSERGDYKSSKDAYHQHVNYITTGKRDKVAQQAGQLHDSYRSKTMVAGERRNLDHVVSAKEIHDDPGRILAGLDGIDLANQDSNLQATLETINKSKKQASVDDWLSRLPRLIDSHQQSLEVKRKQLNTMPRGTPEQKHKVRQLQDDIRSIKNKIESLKSVDHEAMRKRGQEARAAYNSQIDRHYYTSGKFFGNAALAAGKAGLSMGARQVLGLIAAECWFELRSEVPGLLDRMRQNFSLDVFLDEISSLWKGIWRRVKVRFKDFLNNFKEGVFGGVMAGAMMTVLNIFASTGKNVIKIIREMWGQLAKAIKLVFFNPDDLPFIDLCQAVVSVLSAGVAAAVGAVVYAQVLPLCSFPFGTELAAFIGALVTGVLTLGMNYFFLHSALMQDVWNFLASTMPHVETVQQLQAANAELDRYLLDLARLEFNLDADELEMLTQQLDTCVDEVERNQVLSAEIHKKNIELPFEMGQRDSTVAWLTRLTKS